jgi:PAS domain S-box-containing protein
MKLFRDPAALRAALIYLFFGMAWVFVTDYLLAGYTSDLELVTTIATYKGWLFVLLSAGLIGFLVHTSLERVDRAQDSLRASQTRYQQLFTHGMDAIIYTDEQLIIQGWNRGAEQLYGWPADAVIGYPIDTIIPTNYLSQDAADVSRQYRAQGFWLGEVRQPNRDGRPLAILSALSQLRDDAGQVTGMMLVNRDVSAWRRTETDLQRYRLLANHASDAMLFIRPADGQILDINRAALSLYGYSHDELCAMRVFDLRAVEHMAATTEQLRTAVSQGIRFETVHWDKAGNQIAVEVSSHAADIDGEQILLNIVRDISQRKQTERQLQEAHQQLQALSRRLVEAHEQERRSIARELHDEIGQVLTGLKLMLSMAEAGVAKDSPLATTLVEARSAITELIGKVRSLTLDLRPALLDDLGLVPALEWFIDRYSLRTGVHVELCPQDSEQRFLPEVETVAYRVIQEALTNVARYAGVDRVMVAVHADAHALCINVADDGCGFDVATVLSAQQTVGLRGMYERVQLLDGSLTIESMPGRGTRIHANLPLCNASATPASAL